MSTLDTLQKLIEARKRAEAIDIEAHKIWKEYFQLLKKFIKGE